MHTRVSISSWSGHAVTGFAFPRSTLHFSKPGERGLVLQSNIYLCWKSSRETTPLGRYPLQRLCRHSWDGVVLGPNPFSFLLCNGTQMTLWAKSCSAKRPHSPALSAPGGATETQAEVTLWDIWSNSGAAFFQTPTWSPRRQPLALGNIKASGAGAGGAGRPLTVSAATPTLVGLPAALFYVWEKKKKNLSRTVKSPIFHPLHKITREPASFKDSGRRNETPRSETKEFTAHSTAHGHSCFPAPPSPVSSSPMGVGGIPGMQQLCIKAKEPQTQEIWFWGGGGGWLAVNTPVQPLPRKETLSLLYCTTNTSSLCPRGKHFIFQSCLQPVSWWRHSRTKALSASVHKTQERPVEDPSPQWASILFKLPLVPISVTSHWMETLTNSFSSHTVLSFSFTHDTMLVTCISSRSRGHGG